MQRASRLSDLPTCCLWVSQTQRVPDRFLLSAFPPAPPTPTKHLLLHHEEQASPLPLGSARDMGLILKSSVLLPFCVIFLQYYILNVTCFQLITIELQ